MGFSIFPSEVLTASFLGVVAFGAVVGAFGAAEGVLGVLGFAVAANLGVRLIVVGVAVARGVEFRGARGVVFRGALGAVLLAVVGALAAEDDVVLSREEGLEVVGTLFMDDMRLDTPLSVGLLFSSTLAMRKGCRAAVAAVLLVADLTDALLPGRAAVDSVGPLAEELPNLARGGRVLSALPAGVRPDMAMVL